MRAFNVFSVPAVFKFVLARSMDEHQKLRMRVDALEEAVSALTPRHTSAQPVVTDAFHYEGSVTTPITWDQWWPRAGKA